MNAKIQVHDKSAWECRQSRHGHLPKLPARGILVAPSQQFKTTALTDMILRHYTDGRGKSCFERIFIFSPSVDIDSSWGPVKEFVRVNMGVPDSEKCFFHEFDHDALNKIVENQHKMTIAMKEKKGNKKLFNILVVIDDWSDDPSVLHNQGKNVLNTLFTRGRHQNISCWISAQKLTTISTVIRTQTQFYCIGRLRSNKELQAILEEISATYPVKTLQRLYDHATEQPHGFLYINLSTNPPEFYSQFTHRLTVRPTSHSSLPSSARSNQKTIEAPEPNASQIRPP
jgi:hypothetical protein